MSRGYRNQKEGALYGAMREEIHDVPGRLVDAKDGVEIVEGSVCGDHIHMCLRIAPQAIGRQGDGALEGQECAGDVRSPSRVARGDGRGQDTLGLGLLRQHGGDKRERDQEARA